MWTDHSLDFSWLFKTFRTDSELYRFSQTSWKQPVCAQIESFKLLIHETSFSQLVPVSVRCLSVLNSSLMIHRCVKEMNPTNSPVSCSMLVWNVIFINIIKKLINTYEYETNQYINEYKFVRIDQENISLIYSKNGCINFPAVIFKWGGVAIWLGHTKQVPISTFTWWQKMIHKSF